MVLSAWAGAISVWLTRRLPRIKSQPSGCAHSGSFPSPPIKVTCSGIMAVCPLIRSALPTRVLDPPYACGSIGDFTDIRNMMKGMLFPLRCETLISRCATSMAPVMSKSFHLTRSTFAQKCIRQVPSCSLPTTRNLLGIAQIKLTIEQILTAPSTLMCPDDQVAWTNWRSSKKNHIPKRLRPNSWYLYSVCPFGS